MRQDEVVSDKNIMILDLAIDEYALCDNYFEGVLIVGG